VWAELDLARRIFFADCDDATAKAAVDRLRPQSNYLLTVPFSLAEFTIG
jgi:hypothetical protein